MGPWRRAVTAATLGALAITSAPASCVDYLDADAGAPRSDGSAPGGGREDGGADAIAPAGDGATPAGDAGCDYACVVLKDKPVLYLRFEEEGSTTQATDSSPSGFHGVYPQAGASKGAAGIVGRAVKFSGQGPQQITMPSSVDFSGAARVTFSIELWAKPDITTDFQFLIDHERFDTRGGWLIGSDTGNVQLELEQNNATFAVAFTSSAPFTVGKWHHLVFTYDSSNGMAFVWVDAKLEYGNVIASHSNLPTVGTWSIGKQNCTPCAQGSFMGTIDELAVYDHLLDQATVDTHYKAARQQ